MGKDKDKGKGKDKISICRLYQTCRAKCIYRLSGAGIQTRTSLLLLLLLLPP
jgi:hypothetical protein